jgi:hypothetical protein
MNILRKTLAIALTAATLGLGAIETTTSASAHGFFHGGHGGGFHHGFGRVGHRFGWDHHRFGREHRFGWGYGHRWGYHWCRHYGCEHRWGYHWGGYRRVEVAVAEAPISPICPEGTHLGYNGKYCWPNRR